MSAGMTSTGLALGDTCTVDILIEPSDGGPLVMLVDLGIAPNRGLAIATVARWAKSAGATVKVGDEYCDDEGCTFPVTMPDGTPDVQAFIHHDTSNLEVEVPYTVDIL